MAEPSVLVSATPEERIAFRWVKRRAHLDYETDFLFWPLLLGGINLGYLSVDFYFRSGTALPHPLAWRIRPRVIGEERRTEAHLLTVQEESSTVEMVRIDSDNVKQDNALRRALRGQEMVGV
jgi:hypothetical protein